MLCCNSVRSLAHLCSLLCSRHLHPICGLDHVVSALPMSAAVGHAGDLSCSVCNVLLQVKSKHPDIKFGEVGKKLGELTQGSLSDHLGSLPVLVNLMLRAHASPLARPTVPFRCVSRASHQCYEAAFAFGSLTWPTYFDVPQPVLLCFLQARCGSRSHQQRRRSMRTRQLRTICPFLQITWQGYCIHVPTL